MSVTTSAWAAMLVDAIENNYQVSSAVTTEGQYQCLLDLVSGGSILYSDLVNTPYDPALIEYLMQSQKDYFSNEVVNRIELVQKG